MYNNKTVVVMHVGEGTSDLYLSEHALGARYKMYQG